MKRLLLAVAVLTASISAFSASAQDARKRVLFISSYHPAFPSFDRQVDGLRSALRQSGYGKDRLLLDIEFMDSKRFAKSRQIPIIKKILNQKLSQLPRYDVVVVGDDNAFNFALSEQEGLFQKIPIVFLGVNNVDRAMAQNNNPLVTGVIEKASGKDTLLVMSRMFPEAPTLYAIHEEVTPTGKANTSQAREEARELEQLNIEFISVSKFSYQELWQKLQGLPKGAPILLRGAYRDKTGKRQNFSDVLKNLRKHARGPLFSVQAHGLGRGIFGGVVISHFEQGASAGRMVAAVLSGVPVSQLPVDTNSPNVSSFDYNELQRFGVEMSQVPSGSEIINEPVKSAFWIYGPWFAGGGLAILIQMSLIVILIKTNRHRRHAELTAQESQSRLQAFLDNSPSVMMVKDREHKMVMVNARYLSLHNVTEEEVIGKRGGSTLSVEERAKMEEADQKVMDSAIPTTSMLEVNTSGGDQRYYNVSKFPVFGKDGMVEGIGTINTDVTELHRREEMLEQARAEAEVTAAEAQVANQAKSEFLASMSHEIRTPLNGVLGMAGLLMEGNLTQEQQDQVETIRTSGGLLLSLLNDILDLSKIEAGKMELEDIDFDLSALLKSVADLWAPKAMAAGIEYAEEYDGIKFPALRSDPTRIRQILFNFLSNSLKFTAAGHVTVNVTQEQVRDGVIRTRFEVRDTGPGIDSDVLPNLFQKFSQADTSVTRKHGGTGLGLAISKQLAEAMGGEIGAESEPGQGSTFWFTIEGAEGEIEQSNAGTATSNDPVDGEIKPLRILVAEDNDVNQKVIAALLLGAGHKIDIVGNGIEAVSAVVRGSYDVVLMDVQMPEMDGISATKRIRELKGEQSSIPIVALTANAMKGDEERYRNAGMDDYVSKPIEREKLEAALLRQCGSAISLAGIASGSPEPEPGDTDSDLQDDLNSLLDDIDRDIA